MRAGLLVVVATLLATPASVAAQGEPPGAVFDTVVVIGAERVPPGQVLAVAAIPTGVPLSYRDAQRAIEALYATGQFRDVRITQGTLDGRTALRIEVVERPLLTRWSVRGVDQLSEGTVRDRISLREGTPFDAAAAHRSRAAVDSLYRREGFYRTDVRLVELPQSDGTLRVVFDVDEGRRVAISQIRIEGNDAFPDDDVVGAMKTGPEGFFWFQRGEYNETELERDLRERLPEFYGARGYIDVQVVDDTLIVGEGTGKATLVLTIDEGDRYEVGTFEIVGNRQFSAEQLEAYYPFGERTSGFLGLGGTRQGPPVFDEREWNEATQRISTLYANNGYLYADIRPVMSRRVTEDGRHVVDLRWQIMEGQPAVIHKVDIVGNTVTHESVVRRATFPLVPGDIFRQDALIRAYQSVSNLGFFQQPLPIPDIRPVSQNSPDVDVVFRVEERRTGNVNFGASVGQGTGLGGFLGLDEPNLFGRGKRVQFQWQFGRNISDFNITYSDPAIRGSLISGSISLHNTRLRFTVADLGRITTRGGSVQLGFPILGSRFTRLVTSYTLEESDFQDSPLTPQFNCVKCVLSQAGVSIVRDTRIDLPFPTGGALHEIRVAQAGGVLGGSGNFRRATFEGRWYAPIGQLGGDQPGSSPLKFLVGLTVKSGFVWGDPGPHFRQLFSMGGTQFGVPLRGYDEFSITPDGFDPVAGNFRAGANAFGESYFATTAEIGLRISQALYLNTFFDAGNVWGEPQQFNPTRLFRGAGLGLSVLSPLGPLGLDYAYGFDKVDADGNAAPSWKFHFKIGNFF